jgi:predicted PurR-regulated permease PerM
MSKSLGPKVFLLLLLLSLGLLLSLLWGYLPAIVLALLISSVFYPLFLWVRGAFRGRENAASFLVSFFILLVLLIPVGGFIGTLSQEAFELYTRSRDVVSLTKIQDLLESDSRWVQQIKRAGSLTGIGFSSDDVEALVASVGRVVGFFLYKQLSSLASNVFNLVINFLLMMLIIFFLFRDGGRLRDYLNQLIPLPQEQIEKVASKFQEMGKAIIVGNGLSGLVQGFLGGLGFFLFGLSSPFLWGTVMAFMAFIPILGVSIIFLPAAAVLMLQGETGTAIGFLLYNFTYSSTMEYLIKPRWIGKGMRMNSILVFIGIIGGIKLFGIIGIIYGPLIITIFLTLAEIYRLEYKEEFS